MRLSSRVVASNPYWLAAPAITAMPPAKAATVPALLRQCVMGYILFLPIQFATGGSMRIAPSDLFILLFLGLGLFHIRIVRTAWSTWHVGLLGAFLMGTIIASQDQGELSRYVVMNKDLGLVTLFLTFAIITTVASDWSAIRKLARLFVITVVLNAAAALIASVLSNRLHIEVPYFNYQETRLSGLLIDPNAFGGIVAVATVIHLITWFGKVPLMGRSAAAISALVLVVALIQTFSRSAWIGFSAAMLSLPIFNHRIAFRLGVLGLAVLIPIIFLLSRADLADMDQMARRPEQIQARVDQFTIAAEVIKENPLCGIGIGTFSERHNIIIHNTTIWMATEFGIVGLVIFLGMYFAVLAKGISAYVTAPLMCRPLILGLIGAHITMLGVSAGIEALYQRHWWFVMALLGACFSLSRKRRPNGSTAYVR